MARLNESHSQEAKASDVHVRSGVKSKQGLNKVTASAKGKMEPVGQVRQTLAESRPVGSALAKGHVRKMTTTGDALRV